MRHADEINHNKVLQFIVQDTKCEVNNVKIVVLVVFRCRSMCYRSTFASIIFFVNPCDQFHQKNIQTLCTTCQDRSKICPEICEKVVIDEHSTQSRSSFTIYEGFCVDVVFGLFDQEIRVFVKSYWDFYQITQFFVFLYNAVQIRESL